MSPKTPTSVDDPVLTDESRTAVVESLTKYGDITVVGSDSVTVVDSEITEKEHGGREVSAFDVLVDVSGRLDLEEVMERQGLLIHAHEEREISVKGFEDGQILLEVLQYRE